MTKKELEDIRKKAQAPYIMREEQIIAALERIASALEAIEMDVRPNVFGHTP